MKWNAETIADRLLPRPRQIRLGDGIMRLPDVVPLIVPNDLPLSERDAVGRFCECCLKRLGIRIEASSSTEGAGRSKPGIEVRIDSLKISSDVDAAKSSQGYRLEITSRGVELAGFSAVGLYYGLQTLIQLALAFSRDWPCVEIVDYPDYAVRGLSFDVTRGKVPTIQTLKELVDRLAFFKLNQLQLYIEHTFAFAFNPAIGRGCDSLTAQDIRVLDDYCARRRIELVPAMASFGHMADVLSLREYRHLAEIETTKSRHDMTWRERMHGLTLDVTQTGSRVLLTKMYDELLPLFSGDKVNVTCDETYDLGKGKTAAFAAKNGVGELYLSHLRWLDELCRRYGKRTLFWGDIIKKYPDLIRRIPSDAVALNWGYEPTMDYDSTRLFREAGLETYVCPGTQSWNRILNDINSAEINIRGHATAGLKYGASGLLNTDWGDDGHVNLLASSWHPIVLGSALSWNAGCLESDVFDRAFGWWVWEDESGEKLRAFREVVSASAMRRNWPNFYEPLEWTVPEDPWSDERLNQWSSVSRSAAEVFAHGKGDGPIAQDFRELAIGCRISALLADRFLLSRELGQSGGELGATLRDRLRRLAKDCDAACEPYEEVWLARNRRSNLDEILHVFRRLAAEARAAAGR